MRNPLLVPVPTRTQAVFGWCIACLLLTLTATGYAQEQGSTEANKNSQPPVNAAEKDASQSMTDADTTDAGSGGQPTTPGTGGGTTQPQPPGGSGGSGGGWNNGTWDQPWQGPAGNAAEQGVPGGQQAGPPGSAKPGQPLPPAGSSGPATPPDPGAAQGAPGQPPGTAGGAGPNTPGAANPAGSAVEEGPIEVQPGQGSGATPSKPGAGGEVPELPGFVKEQPGFIPDKSPEDLFGIEPGAPATGPVAQADPFATMLGPSRLPEQTVEELIKQYQQNPADNLKENFARVIVPTGTIQGSTETKQFHIEGGLIVFYNDVTITGDVADIDEKNELAVITGNVKILDPKYTMETDELRVFFSEKRFQADGFVQFKKNADPNQSQPDMSLGNKDRLREYLAGQQFELYCSRLFYNWDTKELSALESVRLVHPSFNGTMERIDYNDETKAYEMNGTILITVDKYDWIFNTKVVAANDEKKVQAITDQPTKITCDQLSYNEETGIAQFYALGANEVVFDQTARKLVASYIEVNDNTKDFYAEGDGERPVRYDQQNGQWLFKAELLKSDEVSSDLSKALEGPLTAQMQTMAYNYDRKRVELLGGVNIVSGPRSMDAEELIQDETAKYFLLRGNVHVKPDSQSEVIAAQIYLDTANDVMTFVGLVQGEMFSNDLATEEASSAGTSFQAAPGLFSQNARQGTGSAAGGAAGRENNQGTSNTAESR